MAVSKNFGGHVKGAVAPVWAGLQVAWLDRAYIIGRTSDGFNINLLLQGIVQEMLKSCVKKHAGEVPKRLLETIWTAP